MESKVYTDRLTEIKSSLEKLQETFMTDIGNELLTKLHNFKVDCIWFNLDKEGSLKEITANDGNGTAIIAIPGDATSNMTGIHHLTFNEILKDLNVHTIQ